MYVSNKFCKLFHRLVLHDRPLPNLRPLLNPNCIYALRIEGLVVYIPLNSFSVTFILTRPSVVELHATTVPSASEAPL